MPAIVSCEDGNFRPVDLQFAPDGSLYIVDWHNALIGHLQHNLRDPSRDHKHGRILRLTVQGRPLQEPVAIHGQPIGKLLENLKHPVDGVRHRSRVELSGRDSDASATQLFPPAITGAISEVSPNNGDVSEATTNTTPIGSRVEKLKCDEATGLIEPRICWYLSHQPA